MIQNSPRRRVVRFVLAVLSVALAGPGLASGPAQGAPKAQATAKAQALREEAKSLETLYEDALAEGGELVVYAGGDVAAQQESTVKAFQARFPKIRLRMVVDYSKFHDVRVDNQIATGSPVPDVVQLQTLQNFARWKQQGRLLPYKPAGFSKVHRDFRDADGTWSAIGVIAFSYMVDPALGDAAPASPRNLVDPAWRGKIASSYPNDDDATLFLYKLYAETYGWDWIGKLAAQEIQFARGTHNPAAAVRARKKAIGLAGSGSLTAPATAPVRWIVVQDQPFLAWGQRAAILKGAPHPAAAKLYMNWQLSPERQQAAFNGWSVRTDITPAGGLKPIWTYRNAHIADFAAFMSDRAEVERWRQTLTLYFGEVKGEPSPGWFGLDTGR
jgi:ABC-type Fe3+ transport system substrate-binding protein